MPQSSVKWDGPEPLKVSNSEIQTFKDCRRKWYLTYYRELAMKRANASPVGPLQLGTKIHNALELLYTKNENPVTAINEMYDEDLRIAGDQPNFEDVQVEIKKERDLARIMLEGFMDWREEEGIDAGLKVIGVEKVVEVESGVPGVKLRGKMDQRVVRQSDGAHLFRDWKTAQDFSAEKTIHMDEQMLTYHLLEYLEALEVTGKELQHRTDGALYVMLRKVKRTASAKPPFYKQIEVHHNMEELRSVWYRVIRIIEEIVTARKQLDDGQDHRYVTPPRPSKDCTWKCDFFAVCPLFDDGSNAEGMIDEYYTHLDPHERYNAETNGNEVTK